LYLNRQRYMNRNSPVLFNLQGRSRSNLRMSSFFTCVAVCLLVSTLTQPANGEEFEKTITLLKQYDSQINKAAAVFGIPSRLLVSAIYADRRMHYNLLDASLDVLIARNGRDNSIGIAQVRVSTALWVVKTLKDKNSPYYLGGKFENIIPGEMTRDEMINYLIFPDSNLFIAAAYSAMILKRWKDAGFDIANRVEIFATLYNLGPYRRDETEREPHRNPVANEYGYVAKDFYYSAYLRETFP